MASNINIVGRNRAPGATVNRVASQNRIAGVSVSDGSMVVIAKKGPDDEALVISDYEAYIDRYGDFYNNNYGAPSAKAFFDSGGGDLHVARIVGSGAAVPGVSLKTYDNATDSVLMVGRDKGAGFLLEATTLKASAVLSAAVTSSSTDFTVSTIDKFEQGDLLRLGSTEVNATTVFVQDITPSTNTITCLAPSGMTGTLASGTVNIYCSTRHRVRTTLSANYTSGDATMSVTSAAAMFQGQRLYVSDKTNHGTAVVKSVNGNVITLDASISANITAATSFIVSMEFNLQIKEDGILVENHEYLSMEDEAVAPNNIEHVEVKLAGANNDSLRAVLTDSDGEDSITLQTHMTGFESIHAIPLTQADRMLTGGQDGGTPTPAEWYGVDVSGSETGVYLFNKTNAPRFLCMPGQTDGTAIRTAIDYCQNHDTKGNCSFFIDPPSSDDTVDEIIAFRNVTLQRSSSFSSLPWPWIYIDHPTVTNGTFTMPPAAFYMGRASAVATEVGLRQAPAGVDDGQLPANVKGVVTTISAPEHARLEEAGIIPIVFHSRFGFHFKGAKTLSAIFNGFEWYPTQALYNFIAASLEDAAVPFVFKPNSEETRDRLRSAVDGFMESLHAAGEFSPQSDPTQAFFVKCDSENNPTSVVDSGNLVCDVGFNAPVPAVFINFRVGRYNGKVTVVDTGA